MKIKIRILFSIFLILLLGLIVFLLRSFFYKNLVEPIIYFIWLIIRILLSINQEVFWVILILLVTFVGLLIFPKEQQNKIRSSYLYSNKVENRVTYWKGKFQSADKDTYGRESLQQNLEDLVISNTNLHGNMNGSEICKPNLKAKPWYLFLVKGLSLFKSKSQMSDSFSDSELERNLNQILDSMESQLEMQNERISSTTKKR